MPACNLGSSQGLSYAVYKHRMVKSRGVTKPFRTLHGGHSDYYHHLPQPVPLERAASFRPGTSLFADSYWDVAISFLFFNSFIDISLIYSKKCTLLKCLTQYILVYSQSSMSTFYLLLEHYATPKHTILPPSACNNHHISVNLPTVNTSYKWNDTLCSYCVQFPSISILF